MLSFHLHGQTIENDGCDFAGRPGAPALYFVNLHKGEIETSVEMQRGTRDVPFGMSRLSQDSKAHGEVQVITVMDLEPDEPLSHGSRNGADDRSAPGSGHPCRQCGGRAGT